MKLKLAHLGDLTGLYFNIPYYQRGYRWEARQVLDMLDDLFEFSQSRPNEQQFYCLQPLVVCLNDFIKAEHNVVFDVIDGQQRLTTIFLLMGYLGMDSFCLRYERAVNKGEDSYIWDNGILSYEKLQSLSDADMESNPDYFYMKQAMMVIKDWFEKKTKRYPGIKRLIGDVLLSPNYERGENVFYEMEEDKNRRFSDVRFIWYDASGGLAGNSTAIFKRLNYGKTPLTASELIKALLFQCDIYDAGIRAEMKQIAFRMSTEWDAMEKALQDDFMWSMLFPQKYDKASRIDIVLSFVANELKTVYNIEVNASDEDKDYNYLVINKYLEHERQNNSPYQDIVKEIWTKIQDTYAIFRSWFADRELYHLTGLYLTLVNQKNIKDHLKTLRILVEDFKRCDRQTYIVSLKKKIGGLIRFDKNKFENPAESSLENIHYGRFSGEIVRILLVYNVEMTMRRRQDRAYFPFKFYQDMTPSLEHIHPQHLHDEDIDFATRCRWFKDKCSELCDEDLKDRELQMAVEKLRGVLYLSPDEEVEKKSDVAKKSFKEKEELYNANEYEYSQLLKVVDRYFDELADIDEKELHCISNLALVDNVTNIRLGNGLLNTKRAMLQRISKEYDCSNGKDGACVFIGTWRVFNKECTPEADNLRFWTKIDRYYYFNDLKTIYDEYTK
jgi:hypothetical protein